MNRSLLLAKCRPAILLGLLPCLFFCAGCVHRQFTITSDPPGAIVQVNGKTVGAAPVDYPFTYYGNYHITLLRDGFETLVVEEPVRAPWYEYFPLDFISEHLIPWTTVDHRRFHYPMSPLRVVPPEEVLQQSQILRGEGQMIGAPITGTQGLPPVELPPPNLVPPGINPANGQPPPPQIQLPNPPSTSGAQLGTPIPVGP